KFVDWHGREALNFSINMMIYNLAGSLIITIIAFATCGIGAILLPLLFIVPIYALIMHIVALNSAKRGELYRYPLIFRMIGPPEGAESVAEGIQSRSAGYQPSAGYAEQGGAEAEDYAGAAQQSGGGSALWIVLTACICLVLLFGCFGGIGV